MLDICVEKKYLKGNYIGCDFKRAVVGTRILLRNIYKKKRIRQISNLILLVTAILGWVTMGSCTCRSIFLIIP